MSIHPNFWDRVAVKIYPRYLYPSQLCLTLATTNVGMIHKVPDVKSVWKVMDYLFLAKDSRLRFLGLAKSLSMEGDILPNYSVFELVTPLVEEFKSPNKHAGAGDLVCLTPFDRQFIVAAPQVPNPPKNAPPLYYTAASQ